MITDARLAIVTMLQGISAPVFAYPPQTVPLPAVVVTPGEPYLSGHTLGRGVATIRLQVQVMTEAKAVSSLDALVWEVFHTLTNGGWPPGPVPPPRHDPVYGALVCRLPVTLEWKD